MSISYQSIPVPRKEMMFAICVALFGLLTTIWATTFGNRWIDSQVASDSSHQQLQAIIDALKTDRSKGLSKCLELVPLTSSSTAAKPPNSGPQEEIFLPGIGRWDAYRYWEISSIGYRLKGDENSLGIENNTVWFPLYPSLGWLIAAVTGWTISLSLTIISWACVFVACALLSKLLWNFNSSLVYSEDPVRATWATRFTIVLTFLGPQSFHLYARYTESLFLLLLVSFALCMFERKWFLAAVVAGLASACRVQGAFLTILLVVCFLKVRKDMRLDHRLFRAASMSLVGLSGLLVYVYYLAWNFGEPFAFLKGTAPWNLGISATTLAAAASPLHWWSIWSQQIGVSFQYWNRNCDICLAFIAPIMLGLSYRKLPLAVWSLGFFFWILPFVSCSTAGWGGTPNMIAWNSMGRYMQLNLPLLVALGFWGARKPVLWGILSWSLFLIGVVGAMYFGRWR